MLTDLRNRGVKDIFFVVCDGLKGLPDSVSSAFPLATVQTCIIHLIRNTFRYASRKYWDNISVDLRPIYTAPNADQARLRFEEFAEKWGKPYPAIVRLWENAWEEFIPFLDYDVEIRRVLCSTNEIESLNARYRRAVRARGHFPNVLWNQDCQVRTGRPWLTATIGNGLAVSWCGVVPAGVGTSARRCSSWSRAA